MCPSEAAPPGDITRLLHAASGGSGEAFGQLVELLYVQLNELAHQRLRHEPAGHSLSTTGLVHEAYLKLAGQTRVAWQGRDHFFAVASEAMRRVLIDHARRRLRDKRGGTLDHVPLDDADQPITIDDDQAEELLAIDDALQRLAAFNPDGVRIVHLRFFGGLSNSEIATVLGSSERTVRRQWSVAKAWLRRELGPTVRDAWSLTMQSRS
ncbi:MAG: sigma-70 family RNA polymerase sigma factor [Gemmatimonadaceae bacterium]|nr:sigma-70 family RNA polymerase sigma factor [Gemmatimonadaceae bacterium]